MKLGMIGTGRVAVKFVREAEAVPDIEIGAVYNPHKDSAKRFTKEHLTGAEFTDDLDAFLSMVDAVYIASPHKTHFDYIKTALSAGKHVLCEKPMVLKRTEAEEAFGLADEKGLVLMEAIKTAYCPGFFRVGKLLDSDCVGPVKNIEACFTKIASPASRELTDLETGGSFVELGSYVLLPVIHFLGIEWESMHFESVEAENGLDLFTRCSFKYSNALASVTCGLGAKSEGSLTLGGDAGFMMAQAPWWKTGRVRLYDKNGGLAGIVEEPFEGEGLRYEMQAFVDAVAGAAEGNMPQTALSGEESIALAEILEMFLEEREERR